MDYIITMRSEFTKLLKKGVYRIIHETIHKEFYKKLFTRLYRNKIYEINYIFYYTHTSQVNHSWYI